MTHIYNYMALHLDGLSQATADPDTSIRINGSVDFTMDAWIRLAENVPPQTIIAQDGVFALAVKNKSLVFSITGLPAVTTSSAKQAIEADKWQHVCVVFAAPRLSLYIDGKLNCTASFSAVGPLNNAPFVFGGNTRGAVRWVRVFKQGLDTDAVMLSMLTDPPVEPLLAHYDFTQNPPLERITNKQIQLSNNAFIAKHTPAAEFRGNAYVILEDEHIRPGEMETPYSIQAWVWYEKVESRDICTILSYGDSLHTGGITLYIETINNTPFATFRHGIESNPENTIRSTQSITPQKWVNIAVTFKPDKLSLYIDGVLSSTVTGVYPAANPIVEDGKLFLGSDTAYGNQNGGNWFNGAISRVDIWQKELTGDEVGKYIHEQPDISDQNLLGSYDLHCDSPNNSVDADPAFLLNSSAIKENVTASMPNEKESDSTKLFNAGVPEQEPLSPETLRFLRKQIDYSVAAGDIKRHIALLASENSGEESLSAPGLSAGEANARITGTAQSVPTVAPVLRIARPAPVKCPANA